MSKAIYEIAPEQQPVFVTPKARQVLDEEMVRLFFALHLAGNDGEPQLLRMLSPATFGQMFRIQSTHELDDGSKVVVTTEFTGGSTTIDLVPKSDSLPVFSRG